MKKKKKILDLEWKVTVKKLYQVCTSTDCNKIGAIKRQTVHLTKTGLKQENVRDLF